MSDLNESQDRQGATYSYWAAQVMHDAMWPSPSDADKPKRWHKLLSLQAIRFFLTGHW